MEVTVFKFDKQTYTIDTKLFLELIKLNSDLILYGSNPEKRSGNPYKIKVNNYITEHALPCDVVKLD